MAALTGGADLQHKGNLEKWKLSVKAVGADTFYRGALVYGDATNGKAQAVPAAGDVLLGVGAKTVVAAAADELVEIYTGGLWGFACTVAVVEGDVGDILIMDIGTTQTDNPADLVTGTAATTAAIVAVAVKTCEGETAGTSTAAATAARPATLLTW